MNYFIDVQGTLIDDLNKQPIQGSKEFIDTLNQNHIPYVVVTNNTKHRSEDFYESLLGLGFHIPKGHYLDPFMVLKAKVSQKNVYGFGPKPFLDTLNSFGYIQDSENPSAILIASSKDFDSQDYAKMIEYAIKGSSIVGMHATSIYAKDGKRYPGVGAILQMLQFATGKSFETIGKPSKAFYEEALRLLNLQKTGINFSDVTMVSDDAIGDLCGVKDLGAKTVFVLSGKCKSEKEVLHVRNSLDEIFQSIAEVKVTHG